jgi:hypothetical protein
VTTPDRSTSLTPETGLPPLSAVHVCNPSFCPTCKPDTKLTRAVELAGRHLISLRSDIHDLEGTARQLQTLLAATGRRFAGYPAKIVNRILWNTRGDTIDEIVISDCTVHIEMMSDQQWWIGITRADGGYWAGNFSTVSSRSRMRFTEQEREGFDWDRDDAHREKEGA